MLAFPHPATPGQIFTASSGRKWRYEEDRWVIHYNNLPINEETSTLDVPLASDTQPSLSSAQRLWWNTKEERMYYKYTNVEGVSEWRPVDGGNIVTVEGSTIDVQAGVYFKKLIEGNTTLVFQNENPTGQFLSFILEFENAGAGTITYPGSVTWLDGSKPSLPATGKSRVGFMSSDQGVSWIGYNLNG